MSDMPSAPRVEDSVFRADYAPLPEIADAAESSRRLWPEEAVIDESPSQLENIEKVLSAEDFDAFKIDSGFDKGFHGTFWNHDKSEFLYTKPCHKVDTFEQATEAISLLRFATEQGVLYPETAWGIRQDSDGFQLYATTPRLVNYADSLANGVENRQEVQSIPAPYIGLFDPQSQVLDMYRRLDPDFDPAIGPSPESILQLLNPFEAAHADNWGWDESGKAYPIDVEVLDIASSGNTTAMIHEWYVNQS